MTVGRNKVYCNNIDTFITSDVSDLHGILIEIKRYPGHNVKFSIKRVKVPVYLREKHMR